jgi:WD40 repeat protein
VFRDQASLAANSDLWATIDGTVRLWDPATGRETGIPIPVISAATAATVHDSEVNTVAFIPGGALLAAAGDDGTVQLWETGPWASPCQTLCAEAGPVPVPQWSLYASGIPAQRSCPLLP